MSWEDEQSPWSKQVRDRWFFGALAVSLAAMVYLFSPYLTVLLFAVVVVVVTWPVYAAILPRVRGNRFAASLLSMGALIALIFGPLGLLLYLFVSEGLATYHELRIFLSGEQLEVWARAAQESVAGPAVQDLMARFLPEDFDLVGAVIGPVQAGLSAVVNASASVLPALIQTTVETVIHALLFLFSVFSLYMEGPALVKVMMRLSPVDDRYEVRLLEVFRQFANNMVVGSLATAVAQGVVAGIGFGIAGVDRLVFLGILSGVFSFVPVVGVAVVWVPVSIYVGFSFGWGWGLFVVLWSALITGTVDNVLKPMFLRGSSNIHPLLIFLAVFGGMSWMGLPGALVGPMIVAMFLALYTIYVEDFLGLHEEE
ncbi:MAG: AI-2E family transporter [Deltaproteobacteria bacterium]|nr:AI-2E family transporter [Deltaproteobacteria bacterium]